MRDVANRAMTGVFAKFIAVDMEGLDQGHDHQHKTQQHGAVPGPGTASTAGCAASTV